MHFKKYATASLFLAAAHLLFAQNDCSNDGFESGYGGWTYWIGSVSTSGPNFTDMGQVDGRHTRFHKMDGFDPIAADYCLVNDSLPVVSFGSGKWSLRLGNPENGARADKVVKTITVDSFSTFFLLKYAVLLNDPSHDFEEQPRFELQIKDQFGNLFPCGEYIVRADTGLAGFEDCASGWRVRPWTSVGIELQSLFGQTITIEILTTDCTLGAHAGYAYIDASCKPLEFRLEGYCPGSNKATVRVTEGFTAYEWSSGETTSFITLDQPQPGQPYSVTVTSATGCTLVLSDTIPPIAPAPTLDLSPLHDYSICHGDSLEIALSGTGLGEVYWPNFDFYGNEVVFVPDSTATFLVFPTDINGCKYDPVSFQISVRQPDFFVQSNDTTLCPGRSANLKLTGSGISEVHWIEPAVFSKTLQITPSKTTVLHLEIETTEGCHFSDSIRLEVLSPSSIVFQKTPDLTICLGDEQLLEITGSGFALVFWEKTDKTGPTDLVFPQKTDSWPVRLVDSTGCDTLFSEIEIAVKYPPTIELGPSRCLEDTLVLNAENPLANYRWHDGSEQPVFTVKESGLFAVTVSNDCGEVADSVQFDWRFSDCRLFVPNIFSPNGDGQNDTMLPLSSCPPEAFHRFEFRIFNRWGEQVFVADRLDADGWDGTFRGGTKQPAVYVWWLVYQSLVCPDFVEKKGDLTLVR